MAEATDDTARAVVAALGLPGHDPVRITTGHDADTWRLDRPGADPLALRLLPAGRDPSAELAALRAASARELPVPRVVTTGGHDGRAAIVTTWCPGRTVGELLLAGGDAAPLGRRLGATQARLHRPADDGSVLVHLDFQPFNVLVSDDRVTGIVDWANARPGDPREDLATTAVILAFAEDDLDVPAATVATFADAWRAGYGTFPAPDELAPFLAAAADVQLRTWRRRVESGRAPAWKLAAARRVAESQ